MKSSAGFVALPARNSGNVRVFTVIWRKLNFQNTGTISHVSCNGTPHTGPTIAICVSQKRVSKTRVHKYLYVLPWSTDRFYHHRLTDIDFQGILAFNSFSIICPVLIGPETMGVLVNIRRKMFPTVWVGARNFDTIRLLAYYYVIAGSHNNDNAIAVRCSLECNAIRYIQLLPAGTLRAFYTTIFRNKTYQNVFNRSGTICTPIQYYKTDSSFSYSLFSILLVGRNSEKLAKHFFIWNFWKNNFFFEKL